MEGDAQRADGGGPAGPAAPAFLPPPRTTVPSPPAGAPAGQLRESRVFLTVLAALAVPCVLLRLLLGEAAEPLLAVVLTAVAAATGVLVHRHSARLDRRSRRPWRLLPVVAALLAAGQLVGAHTSGPHHAAAHVPQALAMVVALAACLLFLPSRGGRRPGLRELLDGAIVVVAGTLLAGVLLSDDAVGSRGVTGVLVALGHPLAGALLCAVALMVVSRVSPGRRRPAVWLLVAMLALSVAAVACGLADVADRTSASVATGLSWALLLGAAVRAVDSDPGHRPGQAEPPAGLPLFGLAVSHATAYGVAGIVVAVLGAGYSFGPFEWVTAGVLVLCTSLRSLLWVLDGSRLTRRLLETEAWFRALASSAEDVTVVLDGDGTLRWVSGATSGQLGWTTRELTGRRLADLLDPADHPVLSAVVAVVGTPAAPLPPTVRLRTRGGDVRYVELAGAVRAGVPGSARGDGVVLHLRDVTERQTAQRELERMAFTDYLTGLPNRARFVAALEQARVRVVAGEPSCVLLVDLDGFKAVNDVAGHEAGDRLLAAVADELRDGAREGDLVARLGGDEFALLVPGGIDEATGLAERLVEALDRPYRAPAPGGGSGGPQFPVSGSIGLAELDGAADVSATVRQADLALRAAKAAGKRCVRSSGEAIDAALGRRTRLARDLPAALQEGQLRVLYQPVVGVHDRRVLGLEALVRWEHPLLGTVPPDEFIPLAEEDGLIVPLQRWVLEVATAHAALLLGDGWDLQTGVNVSVKHLQAGCLITDVAGALTAAQLPPAKLVLEITESVLLDTEDRLISDLETLRGMGCVLSLDDFGHGWSSLAYLARLPVQILKMDREFVAGIEAGPRGRALVAGVVELGRALGMDVVAEGVETEGQLAELRAMDCRYLQGYLFGRPMPFAELRALLSRFDPSVLDAPDMPEMDHRVHLVGHHG